MRLGEDARIPLRPDVRVNSRRKVARFKIAYVSPCDAKRCPATCALVLLHGALRPYSPLVRRRLAWRLSGGALSPPRSAPRRR